MLTILHFSCVWDQLSNMSISPLLFCNVFDMCILLLILWRNPDQHTDFFPFSNFSLTTVLWNWCYKPCTYSFGEGNGNPLQGSCQKNPTDRRTQWAMVHGVAKSWTWLSGWACACTHTHMWTHTHTHAHAHTHTLFCRTHNRVLKWLLTWHVPPLDP